MVTLGTGLGAALDASAPDGESWVKGQEVFWETLRSSDGDLEKTLEAALNTAAPDRESWIKGQRAFWGTLTAQQPQPVAQPTTSLRARIRQLFKMDS